MLKSLFREPLVHFAVIAVVILGIDHARGGIQDPERRIVVDDAVRQRIAQLFEEGQGHAPSPEETERLIAVWAQNEALYREGIAMGLDKGDEMFRQRLILKMREVILGNVIVDPPSDETLRGWFEENRDRYGLPERVNFVQFETGDLASGREPAEAALAALADLGPDAALPDSYEQRLRTYRNRPVPSIAQVFGTGFAEGLLEDPTRTWRVLESPTGWHVARVESVEPAVPADFDTFKARIKTDYEAAKRSEQIDATLKELRGRYTIVRLDEATP
ncbi:MAG TPA: peptidylprolyl isomerase [Steroidobacteraceae bacterium]|nr:peptidylprolyl isomerase [Steroidobacteraceae bacterium]